MTWSGRKVQRLTGLVISEYGSRCWLCGGHIDLSLSYPDPARISVDHVVARSRGGGDELSNLRPAHLRCNEARGARPASSIRRAYMSPLLKSSGQSSRPARVPASQLVF